MAVAVIGISATAFIGEYGIVTARDQKAFELR